MVSESWEMKQVAHPPLWCCPAVPAVCWYAWVASLLIHLQVQSTAHPMFTLWWLTLILHVSPKKLTPPFRMDPRFGFDQQISENLVYEVNLCDHLQCSKSWLVLEWPFKTHPHLESLALPFISPLTTWVLISCVWTKTLLEWVSLKSKMGMRVTCFCWRISSLYVIRQAWKTSWKKKDQLLM